MTHAPLRTSRLGPRRPLQLVCSETTDPDVTPDPLEVPMGFRNDVGLSNREATIVRLVAQGRSNDEIARTVWLSLNTIKSYLRSAYQRMGVESRTQAVVWAFDHGLVTPAPAVCEEHR